MEEIFSFFNYMGKNFKKTTHWKSFYSVFFCKKNVFRDLAFLILISALLGMILFSSGNLNKKIPEVNSLSEDVREGKVSEGASISWQGKEISDIQSGTDTSAWTAYQNLWYGFTLKYPNDWFDPAIKKPVAGEMWEQKVEFRMSQIGENNPFEGFNVEIYNIQKIKQLSSIDEFPKLKNTELSSESQCASIEGHLLETGDYPAEEIYIPISDPCYNAALFFSNVRGNYIYAIVPKIKEGAGLAGDPAWEIANHLPEFFSIIFNWNLINIQRPKAFFPKPIISAPMPVWYKKAGKQLVCAKNNDHPKKSNKNKSGHMDMECCLDPDETPNPHCYYSPDKYGKYL